MQIRVEGDDVWRCPCVWRPRKALHNALRVLPKPAEELRTCIETSQQLPTASVDTWYHTLKSHGTNALLKLWVLLSSGGHFASPAANEFVATPRQQGPKERFGGGGHANQLLFYLEGPPDSSLNMPQALPANPSTAFRN